jgi:hypothetical protein
MASTERSSSKRLRNLKYPTLISQNHSLKDKVMAMQHILCFTRVPPRRSVFPIDVVCRLRLVQIKVKVPLRQSKTPLLLVFLFPAVRRVPLSSRLAAYAKFPYPVVSQIQARVREQKVLNIARPITITTNLPSSSLLGLAPR